MPEYLVCYLPYSKTVQGIYKVKGETSVYYRIQINNKYTELISKRTLRPRGSDKQYYIWTGEQVKRFLHKEKLVKKFREINPSELTAEKLEAIIEVAFE
jgi:hypothetical protein